MSFSIFKFYCKGEVHPKMKVSYLVEFGTLSRMVKVRGACDEPFWVYKQCNQLRRAAHDDILVIDARTIVAANAYVAYTFF